MAQQTPHCRRHWAGLVGAALAGSLATGCGGRAPSDADGEAASDQRSSPVDEHASGGSISPNLPAAGPDLAAPESQGPPKPAQDSTRLSGDTLWVGSKQSGVQSNVFLEKSPLGTTAELVQANGGICVRGQLSPVPDGDYPNYWGAEVGLALVANPRKETPDAAALHVQGFAFSLSGVLPPLLRFRVGAGGEVPLFSQYCEHAPLETGVRIEVPLDALTYECWNAGGAPFPVAAGATLISWQVPANEVSEGGFDFCIREIETLR